jgi:hypothetical protein
LARLAAGLVGAGLLLAGTRASAQELYRSPYSPQTPAAVPARPMTPPAPAILAPAVPTLPANPVPVPAGAAPVRPDFQRTALQKDKEKEKGGGAASTPTAMGLPGPEDLFRLDSDAALLARLRRQAEADPSRRKIKWYVPPEPALEKEAYVGRYWPPLHEVAEPGFVCYNRLLFEQLNFERYGWDLGPVTPLLSTLKFYWDVALLPYNLATRPCDQCECSAGYCLPGDPVPFKLYLPEASVSGALAEAGTIVALIAIFP